MEAQVGPRTYEHQNYHCANKLLGYDKTHAYAWVLCQGYTDYPKAMDGSGEGFSVPIRFKYRQPRYSIVAANQPGDGSRYTSDVERLFPRELRDEIEKSQNQVPALRRQVEAAARKQAGV